MGVHLVNDPAFLVTRNFQVTNIQFILFLALFFYELISAIFLHGLISSTKLEIVDLQDAITWTRGSKIREKVLDYNNARDDFDLAWSTLIID